MEDTNGAVPRKRERLTHISQPEQPPNESEDLSLEQPTKRTWKPLNVDRVRANARRRDGDDDVRKAVAPPAGLDPLDDGEKRERLKEAEHYWLAELEDDEWVLYEGELLPPDIAQHVKNVNDTYDQATQRFIATGQALNQMKAQVKHGEWLRVFERSVMRFSIRTADKLMAIARNTAISQNSANMPRSPDALEFISLIKPDVVQEMADRGIINPSMTIEQARRLPAVTLPKVLDDLFEVVMREDAAETAELIAYHLWWLYVHKRGGGAGAAQGLLEQNAAWLTTFNETYKKCEEQHREEWLEQSDAEIRQAKLDKEQAKITARFRKSKGRAYFGSKKSRPVSSWARKLKNTERMTDD